MRTGAGLFIVVLLAILFTPTYPVPVVGLGAGTLTPTPQPVNPLFLPPGRSQTDTLAVNEQGKQYTLTTPQDSDYILTLHSVSASPLAFGLVVADKNHQNDGPEAVSAVRSDDPSAILFIPRVTAGGQIYLQVNEPDHTSPLPYQLASYFIVPKSIKQGDKVPGALTASVPYQSYQFAGTQRDIVTVVAEETRPNGTFLWLTHLVDQVTPGNTIDISNQPIRGSGVFYLDLQQTGDFHLLVGAIGSYSLQVIHNEIQPITAGAHQTTLSDQNPTTIWQLDGQIGARTFLKGQLISGGGGVIRALQFNPNNGQFDELAEFMVSDQAVQLSRELKIERDGPVYILAQLRPAYFRDQVSVAVTVCTECSSLP